MVHLKYVTLTSLLFLFAGAGHAAGSGTGQADGCWRKAFLVGDADAITKCYAPDAVLWFPGGPMAKGSKEIHDGYAGFFSANTVKDAAVKEMGSKTVGNDSVGWGTYTVTTTPKAGATTVTETGRYTEVAKRIGGKWVYVVDHASNDPPPSASGKP
jgi:ketosteroid isomerase-like protein